MNGAFAAEHGTNRPPSVVRGGACLFFIVVPGRIGDALAEVSFCVDWPLDIESQTVRLIAVLVFPASATGTWFDEVRESDSQANRCLAFATRFQLAYFGVVQVEVAKPRLSGSGVRYEIAGKLPPDGRGSATQSASN